MILQNGTAYQGMPGQADYQIAQFERYKARLPHPTAEIKSDLHTASSASLWPINNPICQKRLSFNGVYPFH